MKPIRNYTYTFYKNTEVELTQNPNGVFMLIYRGNHPPDHTFKKAPNVVSIYNKSLLNSEINSAFDVSSYATYKGHKFQVDRFQNGKYRLTTSDDNLYKTLGLHMVDRGWYEIEVPREQIERMWEERKPSGYGFPFPEGLQEIQELDY